MKINQPFIWRLLIFFLAQVLILKRINIGEGAFNHIHFFLFPLAIMMVPLKFSRLGLLFLSFASGILLDFFYGSPGVHAASMVLLAYSREHLFRWLEPRGGYTMSHTPTAYSLGSNWFFSYVSAGMLIYIFCFYNLQAFTLSYIVPILLKTVFSLIFTLVLVGIITIIFNPKS